MDKLYIDCNILIDWLTDRQPYARYAENLITLIEKKVIEGFISPLTLANTYYLLKKNCNKQIADGFLVDSRKIFHIIDLTKNAVYEAIDHRYKDFEDDLHYFTAIANNFTHIITRNKNDFISKKIEIVSAEEYLIVKNYEVF
jgi:predicted nucleic acid-binding protein